MTNWEKYGKKWAAAHPEQKRAGQRRWRQGHPEKSREYDKCRRSSPQRKAAQARYRAKNKALLAVKARQYAHSPAHNTARKKYQQSDKGRRSLWRHWMRQNGYVFTAKLEQWLWLVYTFRKRYRAQA